MNTKARETWSSKLGFVLASLGSAIGLGALWKLPYTIGQNGGGAFILMFLFFNFTIGLPYFIAELLLGRKSRSGVISSFIKFSEKGSSWAAVGWLTTVGSFLILSWYCVVAGWGVCYIFLALTDAFNGLGINEISQSFDALRASGSLNVLFQILFITLNGIILAKGLRDGIERFSKIMTSGLFLVLLGLLVYSMQLDGFKKAVEYILYPDFSEITASSILQALGLALFTLSLAYGVMVTYGSYLKESDDIVKTATIVVVANLFASVLIALTIFPMIFTFGFEPQAGEGLIFKTLPYVFEQLPGSMIIAVTFFVLLTFAATTSSLSIFEVVVANFCDLLNISRGRAVLIACAIVFVLGLPTAVVGEQGIFPGWEQIFGHSFMETIILLIDWIMVTVALFTAIFVGYKMKAAIRYEGFSKGSSLKVFYGFWVVLLRIVVPLSVLLVIAFRAQLFSF